MNWKVHPLVDQGAKAVLLVLIVVAVLVLVRMTEPELMWTVLSGVVLIVSLARYFFPTTYILDERGITIRFLGIEQHRPWTQFRSHYVGRTGVLLSPFGKPHRLESFRGHYMLFGDNREEVVEFVRTHIKQDNKE